MPAIGAFTGGPFHGLAFDALTFHIGIGTATGITIGGVDVRSRVRMFGGPVVRDILNDAPNTCKFTVEGVAPLVGQTIRITINDGARVLFAGTIQTIDHSFKVKPLHPWWTCTAIDDTARANARRPFGVWVDVSATTIATAITPAGFSTAGIAADLPAVSIAFDGSETTIAGLARLATLIGGYAKVEDGVIYLFLEDTTAPPDPIDATHPFLFNPPITINTDASQLRTRVYGKGYGEQLPSDVDAGETILPLVDGATFTPAGGQAIVATTPDGAQTDVIDYTGVVLAEGGTLVGPGAAPGTAPLVGLAAGAGVESGAHDYAYGFVTATGRSLPSPIATIVVGTVASPVAAVTPGTPTAGGNLNPGTHRYYAVFRTAAGATTAGPVSNAVTATAQASAPTTIGTASTGSGGSLDPAAVYSWKYTFYRSSDGVETTPSPASNNVNTGGDGTGLVSLTGVQAPPSGFTRRWYRTEGGGSVYKLIPSPFEDLINNRLRDELADGSLGATAPTSNTTGKGTVLVTAIPVSPEPLVTHVDLYREFNSAGAATAKLAVSVTNGTTSAIDAVANASLGATVPAVNTAVANQVAITWPAGPAAVTDIELFRTAIGSAQLKKFHTVGSNTGGTTTDSTPDASLTTNAPTGDTSGLTQPAGQVTPGSTTLIVASAGPFPPGGGWVRLPQQVIRYNAISGNILTGIPPVGTGAIVTTVLYGQQATPAPTLVGVTGVTRPLLRGSAVHVWVQRDDLAAQAAQAARDGSDGIVEFLIVDTRRGEASLTARCEADLAMFAYPIVTVGYATFDIKTRSGKTVTIALASPAVSETLTIQEVTITDIDRVPGLPPRFTVKASSVRFSLEDTLRRLIVA